MSPIQIAADLEDRVTQTVAEYLASFARAPEPAGPRFKADGERWECLECGLTGWGPQQQRRHREFHGERAVFNGRAKVANNG